MENTEFITDRDIYIKVIRNAVQSATKFLWIGTSDLKDMYVDGGRGMIPFLKVLADLAKENVQLRLIHAKEPGPNFRKDFDKNPILIDRLERLLCPRVHFKCVIVDGKIAYSGSANVTGAGMGAKSVKNRNFESGFITTHPPFVKAIMKQFDTVWMGAECKSCGRKKFCADYADM